MMPTAARLIAGIGLMVLAFIVSEMIKPLLPEGTDFGIFNYVNSAVGFLCGWVIIGARAGRGMSAGISNGFTGTVAMVFWCLFIQGAYEMTRQAMRHIYDGFFEAIVAIFQIGAEYAMTMATVDILLTLFVGGCLIGAFAEMTARRWR